MADMGRRKPAADEPLHTLPLHACLLTPPFENVVPEVTDREAEVSQSIPIPRNSEVSEMPAHNGLQPLADFRNRIMHTPPQLDFDAQQRGLHALANRLPKHHEPSLLCLPADVREAEEVEGLWLAQTSALSVLGRMASELDQPRLFRVQFQLELRHSFFQFRPESFGIVLKLEPNHDVVGITHHDYIAVRTLPTPCLNPEIEDVMEVDIRQQGRCTSALGDIQPDHWLPEYTTELLDVLNVLGLLVELEPKQADLLERICAGPLISESELRTAGALELPPPPKKSAKKKEKPLHLFES